MCLLKSQFSIFKVIGSVLVHLSTASMRVGGRGHMGHVVNMVCRLKLDTDYLGGRR